MIGKQLDCHPEISVAGYAMRWNAGPDLAFSGFAIFVPQKKQTSQKQEGYHHF